MAEAIDFDAVSAAEALSGLVRESADENEARRHLSADVARAFARDGLYRVAAPRDCGGSEQPPRTQIEVIETIARMDGSVPAATAP